MVVAKKVQWNNQEGITIPLQVVEVESGQPGGRGFTSPAWPGRRRPGRPAWTAEESRPCWCCRRTTRCWADGGSLPKRRSRRRGRCGPWPSRGRSVCGSQSASRITGYRFRLQRPLLGKCVRRNHFKKQVFLFSNEDGSSKIRKTVT